MAIGLQDDIRRFFRLSYLDQTAALLDLIQRIRNEATIDLMESQDWRHMAQLAAAVTSILPLPVQLPTGEQIYPGWTYGYTVVQLGMGGDILATCRSSVGVVYEQHGEDLYGFALAKAVLEMFVARWTASGGALEHYAYLRDILPARLISIGAAQCQYPAGTIGVSGAESGPAYTGPFGPGMVPLSPLDQSNFAAGAADLTFAAGLAQQLASSRPLTEVAEPKILNIGRLIH